METARTEQAFRTLLEAAGRDATPAGELAAAFLDGAPLKGSSVDEDLSLGDFPAGLHPYRLASPGLALRAARIGREWLLCHFSPAGVPAIFAGESWPAREARILGDRDTVGLGGHLIDHDSLDLAAAWMDGMPIIRSVAETPSGDLLLSGTCGTDHLALLRFDQGFSITPLPGRSVEVNGRPCDGCVPLFPSDRLRIGRFRGRALDLIRRIGPAAGVLDLKGVTKRFPDGAIGLREIDLRLQAGDFVAIMGPSGSGKSTLLDIIAGAPASSGTVDAGTFRGGIAVVPQHDVLFESLSVEENLRHAGRLRGLPDEAAVTARLEEVLQLVGLAEKRRLRAGSDLDRTLSGGQRRRLSIGLELMGDPRLLILDEPTSGLSGPDAASVVGLLRNLATRGTLVIATIHQPAAELFACFDKLVVLDRGGVPAFIGYAAEAPEYFSGRPGDPEAILGTIMRSARPPGAVAEMRLHEPDHWGNLQASKRADLDAPLVLSDEAPASRPSRTRDLSGWRHLDFVTRREFSRKLKEVRPLLRSLVLTALLGSLVAVVCRQGEDYRYASNAIIPSYAFLAVILSQFLAASSAVGELVKDRGKQIREKLLGIGGGAYVASKLPFLLLLAFLQAGIIAWTGYRVLGIPGGFGAFWLLLGVAGSAASALGLLVSAIPRMTETRAMAAVPLLLIPQIVLAGAEPFAFADLRHLHWPTKKEEREEKSGAPWFAAPVPSRWAYEGAIDAWTGLPVFRELEEAKARRATLNFFKRHRKLHLEDPPAFGESFAEQFGRPFDPGEMKRHVGLLARAGILSEKDVRDTYLLDPSAIAPRGTDLKDLWNDALLAHGKKVVRKDHRLLGEPVGAWCHALAVLGGISAAALAGAVGLNRRALGQPFLPLPRWQPGRRDRHEGDTEEVAATLHAALTPEFRALLESQVDPGLIPPEPPAGGPTVAGDALVISTGNADPTTRTIDPDRQLARTVARSIPLPPERVDATGPLVFAIFTESRLIPAFAERMRQIGCSLDRRDDNWHALPPELHFFVRPGTAMDAAALPWDDPSALAAARNAGCAIFLLERDTGPALAAWQAAVPGFSGAKLVHHPGGNSAETFNAFAEMILQEWTPGSPCERLARQIHIEYSRVEAADRRAENQSPVIGRTWEDLDDTWRDHSRDSAAHLLASLRGLGFAIGTCGDDEPGARIEAIKRLASRLEDLAACEHYRWMASRLLDGWRHGETRDDRAKLHPDLLPYGALPESTKEKDRACVRALAALLRRGEFRIGGTAPEPVE